MKDLRTVGRSEDGDSLELHDLDGNAYSLRINDHLRSLVNQPSPSPLRSVASESEIGISIKEIQARLRAGESMESIADAGNVSLEKVERYSHPILQERSYIISLAQKAELKKLKVTLMQAVEEKLVPRGVESKSFEWNTYRNDDGTWQVLLEYPTRDGSGHAEWRFETVKRRIESHDDGARWILGEESVGIESTVRPIRSEESAPRLVSIRSTPTIAPVREPETRFDPSENVREFGSQEFEARELGAEEDLGPEELELEIEGGSKDAIPSDARRDGVTRKISIPSWDDIMFGVKRDDSSQEH